MAALFQRAPNTPAMRLSQKRGAAAEARTARSMWDDLASIREMLESMRAMEEMTTYLSEDPTDIQPAPGRRPMMLRHATRGLIMAQNVVDAFDAKLLTDLADQHRRRAQRDLEKLQEAELAAFGDGSTKDQLHAKQKAQKLQMMHALDEMDSSLATLLDSDVDPDEDPELGPAGGGSGCESADVLTGTDIFHWLTIAVVRCLEVMGLSRQSSSLTTTIVS